MDWPEESATQQQLLLLQEYGFVPTCPLSVTQAARLIRQYSKHRISAAATPSSQGPPLQQKTAAANTPTPAHPVMPRRGTVSESARVYAYSLHQAVQAAERSLAQNPDRPGARADVRAAIGARQRFWFDTCREDQGLQAASPQALEFYQCFGAHYFTPTWEEIKDVLNALDGAMPGWDKDRPELFYETLKLNFPSLLRHK